MTMTMPEIERCLRQAASVCCPRHAPDAVLQARSTNQRFLETFSLILQDELDRQQRRLIERRY